MVHFAFVVNNYPPRTGGVELHVQALAHELVRKGHRATVVTLGSPVGWRQDAGVEVLTLPEHFRVADILGFPSPGTRRRISRLLHDLDADVVSVHTRFFPMSFVGWRAARAAGLPLIHTEHGSDHVTSDSFVIRTASKAVDLTLGRMVLRGADRVLGVSEAVVAFVLRLSGVGARVFYNAIAVDSADSEGAAVTITGAASRTNHLVFVGRLVPGKGWDTYLDVVSQLKRAGRSVTGEVLGDGADLIELRRRIEAMGLSDAVVARGRVSQQEVRVALRGATLVNPTTLSEGFQTTLLEAIAEGGSVVTYPVPGAAVLAQAGAPVIVSSEPTPDSLFATLEGMLSAPPTPAPSGFIESWTWPARAEEYIEIAGDVLLKNSRGRIRRVSPRHPRRILTLVATRKAAFFERRYLAGCTSLQRSNRCARGDS